MIIKILAPLLIYVGITLMIIEANNFEMPFLNPFRNYDEWDTINWFGIWVITILLNILFLPYAIIYWTCKLIYFLFTVGRREN